MLPLPKSLQSGCSPECSLKEHLLPNANCVLGAVERSLFLLGCSETVRAVVAEEEEAGHLRWGNRRDGRGRQVVVTMIGFEGC